jgi:hypothetical protein
LVDFIAEVEEFIKRRDDGEFAFNSTTMRLEYDTMETEKGIVQLKNRIALGDWLSLSLKHYFFNENKNANTKLALAKEAYRWISIAWNNGAIQEGQGTARKLSECREHCADLEKKLEELSEKYLEATRKIEMFEKKFPPLSSKK